MLQAKKLLRGQTLFEHLEGTEHGARLSHELKVWLGLEHTWELSEKDVDHLVQIKDKLKEWSDYLGRDDLKNGLSISQSEAFQTIFKPVKKHMMLMSTDNAFEILLEGHMAMGYAIVKAAVMTDQPLLLKAKDNKHLTRNLAKYFEEVEALEKEWSHLNE